MKTIDNRIAKTLVLFVSLILSFPVFGQNIDYKTSFNEAYKACPDIPRGLLEAISFTNTHCNHLTDADYFNDDPYAVPRAYGLMGLMKDGKGYFRENLHLVSELSGISETEILQNPSANVMAYAKAFSRLAKESRASEIKGYMSVIQQLSEFPIEENEEDNYPMQSMLYSVCLFLNDAQRAEEFSFPKREINLEAVFAEHYDMLTAQELVITRNGDNLQVGCDSCDYPLAIWDPAPRCNHYGPRTKQVSAVVIHCLQGKANQAMINWLKTCEAGVSAHYIISSSGQITQMVHEADKAKHINGQNGYTIGIEHEGFINSNSYYTDAMYLSSANLVRDICSRYTDRNGNPTIDRHSTFFREFILHNGVPYDNGLHDLGGEGGCIQIRGHQHFPNQTEFHMDPGPNWDWNKYYKLINIDDPVEQLGGTGVRSGSFSFNSGDNTLRKIWVITSDENTYIELKFHNIQLEKNFDFLWFYNGDHVDVNDNGLGPCNLTNTSFGVVSSSNAMCIEFRADCQGTSPSSWEATWEVKDKCENDISCLNAGSQGLRDSQTTNQLVYESITKYHEYMDAMSNYLLRVIGLTYWFDVEKGIAFWNLFQSLLDDSTGMISEAGIQQLINQNQFEEISEDLIMTIAERYNQSVLYWNEGYYTNESLPEGYGNMIEYDTVAMRKAYEAQAYAESLGFNDVRQMYDNAYEILEAEVGNQQTSVCASVTMQFAQKMTMTREAFNGTLQIFNGHESIPMEDILVDFRIEDQQGNNCTDLFQINTLSLDQITGISGDGSLAAQTNGTALVQFIPTKNAAPTQPVVYSFGGSFSFIDPFTGEGLTYPLYPVDITVNPSPDLYVDYFMQRDILGDDALTEDVVEPIVPAELGVIIHNQGAGMAKNVILETAEPQIIDNEKGLAIDFAMYGASFNGSPRQLGLMEIPFGNIESGQTAVGEWLFTSSLLGHFVSYEAHVIHNSSYGNSDLSLVSHLDIHELIHPIYAYGNLDDGINDFLVNDNPDAYDTPDSIYFSHGGKTSVGVVDNISFDHYVSPSDTIVTLTVEPSRVGWNYGVTDDPGMNQYDIVSCIRNNDNQIIPLNNVWLTFVTIPDGGDPVYENKLHIVDTIPVQQTTTYTLVFAKKPSNLRIFHGNEDEYWSNAANWEGYIMPQANDEVLIDGICQLDQDAEVFSLTVAENQSLTIPEDRILTVSGSLTNADASGLIIEEGGQLMHTNTGAQGTVQKDILPYTEGTKDGWYLVSSPLAGFTNVASVSDLLSNNYDLYYYDEPTVYWINQKDAANNFTELTNGKGYLYANNEEVRLGFEGELQSGSAIINVLLNYTEGIDLAGFNLVGNPYAHNVTSYASANVANGCYQLNEAKDDLIVSEIDEDNPLKPAEGFFVKATDEGASITFNSGRGAKANPGGSIRVELVENGKLIDCLIVKLEGEPLEKLSLNESRTKVFTVQSQKEFAIVPCEGNEQPVSFKAAKNNTYTINVNVNDMEFNYLHLIDNLTGADVDMLALRQAQGPMSYTFEAKTTDYASRFKLVFSICGNADDNVPFAFISNGNIIIVGAEAGSVLQIVDVMGRVLVSRGGHIQSIPTSGMAKGVYILRLVNGNNVKTQKIVVE